MVGLVAALRLALALGDGADGADGVAKPAGPPAPEDLFARTYVRELALSPDGRRALVFEAGGDEAPRSRLVELAIAADGSVARSVHELPDDVWGQVAWSGTDGAAALLRASSPRAEVWLAPPGAAPRLAMPPGESGSIFGLFWRPTARDAGEGGSGGEWLALQESTRGPREALLSPLDLERGEIGEPIARFGRLTVREAALSPDGRTLALTGTESPTYAPEGEPIDLYVVDLDEVDVTHARRTAGDVIVSRPAFSPDGRRIACVLQRSTMLLSPAEREIAVLEVAGGPLESVTDGHAISIGNGVYGADESLAFIDDSTLLAPTQHGLADHLLAVELPAFGPGPAGAPTSGSARARFATGGEVSWQKLRVAPAAGRMVAIESSASEPERIVLAGWPELEPRRIESPNDTLFARGLGHANILQCLGTDGERIESLLVTPTSGEAPWPAVILLHGGSSGRQSLRFNDGFVQAWAALGYAVLAPNLPGSAGYSPEFNAANLGDFGGAELDHLHRVVDDLLDRRVADPRRVFLLGHSYGGYLVEMALVGSRRFAAACAASAVSDWARFVATSDLVELAHLGLGGTFSERPELYVQRSPLHQAGSMVTPLLLVHGARDRRVPIEQSETLHAELLRRGVPCELVRFPSKGHVLSGTETTLQWIRGADDFFRRHDGG